jgi:hypothetical protein
MSAVQIKDDLTQVFRATGMVRLPRQPRAGADSAQVHAEHANAVPEKILGQAQHIAGPMAAAQTMHEKYRTVLVSPICGSADMHGQSIAVRQRDRAKLRGEKPARARYQVGEQCLHMRVGQERQRAKRVAAKRVAKLYGHNLILQDCRSPDGHRDVEEQVEFYNTCIPRRALAVWSSAMIDYLQEGGRLSR